MGESPMPTNEAALPYKQKNYNQGTLLAVDMHRQYSDGKVSINVSEEMINPNKRKYREC